MNYYYYYYIIIIFIITFTPNINNYVAETNRVYRVYSVAAILYAPFTAHVMLFPMTKIFYFTLLLLLLLLLLFHL